MTVVRLSVSPDFDTKIQAEFWMSNNMGYLVSRFPNRPLTSAIDKQTGKYAIFGSFPKNDIPENEASYTPIVNKEIPSIRLAEYSIPTRKEVLAKSAEDYRIQTLILDDHRKTFNCKWPMYHTPERDVTRSTYEYMQHELRLRRFITMRKNNPDVFGILNKYSATLLVHIETLLSVYKEQYPKTYAHLLREIQDGKINGIWGVSFFGKHHQEASDFELFDKDKKVGY